jgi:hypothetical protein
MNKLYKPVVSYAKNAAKQTAQAASAYSKAVGASMDAKSYPPSRKAEMNAKANMASGEANKQAKQAVGAIFQARRYKD